MTVGYSDAGKLQDNKPSTKVMGQDLLFQTILQI